jgi:hypothetical protein
MMRINSVKSPVRNSYNRFWDSDCFESDFIFPGLSLTRNQMIQMKTIQIQNQDLRFILVLSHKFVFLMFFFIVWAHDSVPHSQEH